MHPIRRDTADLLASLEINCHSLKLVPKTTSTHCSLTLLPNTSHVSSGDTCHIKRCVTQHTPLHGVTGRCIATTLCNTFLGTACWLTSTWHLTSHGGHGHPLWHHASIWWRAWRSFLQSQPINPMLHRLKRMRSIFIYLKIQHSCQAQPYIPSRCFHIHRKYAQFLWRSILQTCHHHAMHQTHFWHTYVKCCIHTTHCFLTTYACSHIMQSSRSVHLLLSQLLMLAFPPLQSRVVKHFSECKRMFLSAPLAWKFHWSISKSLPSLFHHLCSWTP